MRIRVLLLPLFLACAFSACCCYTSGVARGAGRTTRPSRVNEPKVRVRLTAFTSEARLACDAGLWVTGAGPDRRAGSVTLGRDGGAVTVSSGGGETGRARDTVRLLGTQDALIRAGDRSYRGTMLAFVSGEGELVLVNELGLEEYLASVVPCEIGPVNDRTFEAVKAQAVAARSFTLDRLGRRKGLGHQLFDSYLRDQEYRGAGAEVALATRAVAETRGEVLTSQGEPIEALYHANCGGHTGEGSRPWLKAVRDAPGHGRGTPYCAGGKHYTWKASFTRQEFDEKMAGLTGRTGVRVKGVTAEKDRSGRARHVGLKTDRGTLRVAGADFRFALGLKSTLFEVTMRGDGVTFDGRGWGHGSGLCQEGAVEMARRGTGYRDILKHYYSGVKPDRLY